MKLLKRILNKFMVNLQFEKELFYTDRDKGGRLYHFVNVGVYHMPHIKEDCYVFNVTLLWVSFKLAWLGK